MEVLILSLEAVSNVRNDSTGSEPTVSTYLNFSSSKSSLCHVGTGLGQPRQFTQLPQETESLPINLG